jgi:hypothetical protein
VFRIAEERIRCPSILNDGIDQIWALGLGRQLLALGILLGWLKVFGTLHFNQVD